MQTHAQGRMFTDPADGAAFWADELEGAKRDCVNRLRYAFPELPESALAGMAVLHPAVAAQIRYCRKRLAYYRRLQRRSAAHAVNG